MPTVSSIDKFIELSTDLLLNYPTTTTLSITYTNLSKRNQPPPPPPLQNHHRHQKHHLHMELILNFMNPIQVNVLNIILKIQKNYQNY